MVKGWKVEESPAKLLGICKEAAKVEACYGVQDGSRGELIPSFGSEAALKAASDQRTMAFMPWLNDYC